MGWSGGSELMNEVIEAVKAEVLDADARMRIYEPIYRAFRKEDWDTVGESLGLDEAFDVVVKADRSGWYDDDPEDDCEVHLDARP